MARNKNFKIEKKWTYKTGGKAAFKIPKIKPEILDILAQRGIESEEAAKDFLYPKYEDVSNPLELDGIDVAVKMIEQSVKKKEKIVIYGDYDVDGISSTALLIRFFRKISVDVDYYIPSRENEGYGLNKEAIEKIAKNGARLLITVDCGTNSENEIKLCHEKGIKVIVTDHHEAEKIEYLPDALVNPKKQPGKRFSNLAGVGVAFYLIRALRSRFLESYPPGQEKWLLDLVALGTICDIVPLTYDNRALAKFGMQVMRKSRNIGIKALARVAGFDLATIDAYKIGFLLGPRLNAAGRLEHARESLELLITDDENRAYEIARKLDILNKERQEITEKIVSEAKEMISGITDNRKIFLLANKNWPAGVVGIAASRLVEEYGRPILIMEENESELKGSARSIRGFNIVKALNECRECLTQFGGHAAAAGFTLKKEHFVLLDEKLIKITENEIQTEDITPEILVEKILEAGSVSKDFAEQIEMLAPFGPENGKPIFVIRNLLVAKSQLVGNPKAHLKLVVKQNGDEMSAIAFNYGEKCDINPGDIIDMACSIELNEWQGLKKVDLHLIDIKMNKKVGQNVTRELVNKT